MHISGDFKRLFARTTSRGVCNFPLGMRLWWRHQSPRSTTNSICCMHAARQAGGGDDVVERINTSSNLQRLTFFAVFQCWRTYWKYLVMLFDCQSVARLFVYGHHLFYIHACCPKHFLLNFLGKCIFSKRHLQILMKSSVRADSLEAA